MEELEVSEAAALVDLHLHLVELVADLVTTLSMLVAKGAGTTSRR